MKATYFVSALVVMSACTGGDDETSTVESHAIGSGSQHISDAANPVGNPEFFLLPQLVSSQPDLGNSTFFGGLAPRLRVEVLTLTCDTFVPGSSVFTGNPVQVSAGGVAQYRVIASVTAMGLAGNVGDCFRVTPTLDGVALGYRDVQITNTPALPGFHRWNTTANHVMAFTIRNDFDEDDDGVLNHIDLCQGQGAPPGGTVDANGCPVAGDNCPLDPNKTEPGACGCGFADVDADNDGHFDSTNGVGPDGNGLCDDECDNDNAKLSPGACGCGFTDIDADSDGVFSSVGGGSGPSCNDQCDNDFFKVAPGTCGCNSYEITSEGTGTTVCTTANSCTFP